MNDKKEKKKALVKNIILFVLASFIPRTLSFFLVPLYTNCLTTHEYGTVDLLTTTAQLLLPILTLQVHEALLRFALERNQEPKQIFSIGLRVVAIGSCVLVFGMAVGYATGFLQIDFGYMLYLMLYFFAMAMYNVGSYFLRAIDRVKVITVAAIVNSVVTISANLLFLLVLKMGIVGYLISNTMGHAVSIVILFFGGRLYRYVHWKGTDRTLLRRMLIFSLPMVASALAWWINHSLDKYILTFFYGVSASGVLAVAYKIPTIIATFGGIVSKAFSVSVVQHFDADDKDGFLGESYATLSFFMVLSASGLMLINVPLSRILFAKDFFMAWQIVPPLLAAALMNQMSASCEHICVSLMRTKVIALTAVLGAGINLILNICLIPAFQAYGAALATAISFSVVWLVRYLWVRSKMNLKNCKIKEPISYLILFAQMVVAYWGNRYVLFQIAGFVLILFLYREKIMANVALCLKKLRS